MSDVLCIHHDHAKKQTNKFKTRKKAGSLCVRERGWGYVLIIEIIISSALILVEYDTLLVRWLEFVWFPQQLSVL